MAEAEFHPGTPAPTSGIFLDINVFGTLTRVTAQDESGDPLPAAPIGFRWMLRGFAARTGSVFVPVCAEPEKR